MTVQAASRIPSGMTIDSGSPRCAMPSFTSAPPTNFMAALKKKRSDTTPVITRPVHTIFPLAPATFCLLETAAPSVANGFPDAAVVLVDVTEQAAGDQLLGGHRRYPFNTVPLAASSASLSPRMVAAAVA